MTVVTKDAIIEQLKTVKDPELGMDIYSLGLIYGITIGETLDILMTLTTPFCPYGEEIITGVEKTLGKKFDKEVKVDITFEPEWQPSEELKLSLGLP